MRNKLKPLKFILLLVVIIFTFGCDKEISQNSNNSSSIQKQFDELVNQWVAEPLIPSIILRIDSKEANIYSGAAGTQSFESQLKTTPDSYFRSASVGKMFTAVTVLRLAEKEIINLHDRLDKFLPADLVNRLHIYQGISYGPGITIEQLLSHTSGLPNTDNNPKQNEWVINQPERNRTPEELLEFAIEKGPDFKPGTGQQYSSPGYTLLGLVIEGATNKKYHEVVREEVLDPMSLNHTWEEANELPANISYIHSYAGTYDMNQCHPSFEFADGGFVTTASDLNLFGIALSKNELFTKQETLTNMMRPRGTDEIGLGPFTGRTDSGVRYFCHPGHWGVMLFVFPEKGISITFTINQTSVDYLPFLDKIIELTETL